MTSRVAMQEFRTAVTSADGDVEKLKETLGITGEMFDEYSSKVEESSDVISENARRNNELYTPMQKIQHALGEMKYAMSGYIETAAKFAPALYLVGPAMKGFALGAKGIDWIMKGNLIPTLIAATTKVWAFTTAILANPLTWWVVGITAVITAIYLLWKNWDEVTQFISRTIDWIGDKIKWLGDAFKWVAEKLGIYKEKTAEIIDETDGMKDSVDEAKTSIDDLETEEAEAAEAAKLLAEKNEELKTSLEGTEEIAEKAAEGIKVYAEDVEENYMELAAKAGDSWEDFYAFWEAEAKRTAKKIIEVNKEVEESTPKPKPSNLYKIVGPDGETLGLQSGNRLTKAQRDEGITLVKLHEGGTFRAPTPGGEGLALLEDNEQVLTEEQAKMLHNLESELAMYQKGYESATGTDKEKYNILIEQTIKKIEELKKRFENEYLKSQAAELENRELPTPLVNEPNENQVCTNEININIPEGAVNITAQTLDEATIKNAGKWLFEEIQEQFRANNIILQRG